MEKFDVKTLVLDKVNELLSGDLIPWRQPWFSVSKRNFVSGKPYRGVNRWMLALDSEEFYLTFNQINELGLRLKQGSKSRIVVFWKFLEKKVSQQSQDESENNKTFIPLLRYYRIFRASDVEGLTEEMITKKKEKLGIPVRKNETDLVIDDFISKLKSDIRFGGDRAFYSVTDDYIQIPKLENFESTDTYYETIFHELVHWTKAKERLDRSFKQDDDKAQAAHRDEYSREELVAEIGSVLLLSHFGRKVDINNSSAYLSGWASYIKQDKNCVFSASTKAEEAVNYLLKLGGRLFEEEPVFE